MFCFVEQTTPLFRHSNCPTSFKLTTFDAVIRAKLVYGLEVVHLPQNLLNKLNALQLKGLRQILHMDTTFVNRANSNIKVFETANTFKNPKQLLNKKILTVWYVYQKSTSSGAQTYDSRSKLGPTEANSFASRHTFHCW